MDMYTSRARKNKSSRSLRYFIFIAVMMTLFAIGHLRAGSEDDAIAMYHQIYKEAMKDIENGNTFEKIDGAHKLGGHRVARYVRPLGRELNRNLEDPELRKIPTNDPYVKSNIAWAIGRIGHRWSIPYLLRALENSVAIVDEKLEEARKYKQTVKEKDLPIVVNIPDRATPALMQNTEQIFPASPDVFWSVADEFRVGISIVDTHPDHAMRLIGYNYVNLTMEILRATGEVARQNRDFFRSVAPTKEAQKFRDQIMSAFEPMFTHEVPDIRGTVALALGDLGTDRAMKLLVDRFPEEKDFSVKVRIARAILMNDKSRTAYYDYIIDALPSEDMKVRREVAVTLRDLKMGESIFALREAYRMEANETIRQILKDAIYNAEMDNILPINY